MDIKLLSKEQETLRFVLSDVSPAFANALRRIMISEIPVMAIDDVMILENNSVMYDEILAHRLGLVPVTTDGSYNLPEECTCKSELGCEKCRASFSLEIEASEPIEVVYSSQLKPENPKVNPVSDKISIVKLTAGQESNSKHTPGSEEETSMRNGNRSRPPPTVMTRKLEHSHSLSSRPEQCLPKRSSSRPPGSSIQNPSASEKDLEE